MLCQSWNNLTLSQDEFKQWFRAKAHVMLAPGRTPFESVDLQLPNGDRSIGAAHEEHRGKFAERQPAQVPQWKTVFFGSICCSSKANSRLAFKKTFKLRVKISD